MKSPSPPAKVADPDTVAAIGAAAEALVARLATAFPGRLYVELQRHGTGREAVHVARVLRESSDLAIY